MKQNLNYDQAVKAYQRHCKRNGYIYQEPNYGLSDLNENGRFWELHNSRGLLAKIDVTTGKAH